MLRLRTRLRYIRSTIVSCRPKLRWSLAVNKSQGQTLERVAVFLGKPTLNDDGTLRSIDDQACFAHGQLYVALSRVGHPDRVRELILMRARARACV